MDAETPAGQAAQAICNLQPQLDCLLIGERVWRRDVVCGVPKLFKFIITFRLEGKHWRKIIFHTSLLLSGMTWRLVVGRLSSCLLFVNVGIINSKHKTFINITTIKFKKNCRL